MKGVEASEIWSDQAPCPEGLDVVRAYGAHCCALPSRTSYCSRCDLLVGRAGLHATAVEFDHDVGLLTVHVESAPVPMGCTSCGVIARSHGRRDVVLVDASCFDRPVRLVWRKRTWKCVEPACSTKVFTEQDEQVAVPRALLTTRACWWAINQVRREHAFISGIARQLGTTWNAAWNTVWASIRPLLRAMADDQIRFAGVRRLGVDEHVWHHVSEFPIEVGGRGPKQLTGMVDLTPDEDGNPRARLLDLVPGRSGRPTVTGSKNVARASATVSRSPPSTRSTATRTPSTTSSRMPSPCSTPSTSSNLAPRPSTRSDDEVRRRVQQEIHGHRGRKNDPLYGIRMILRCGAEKLTDRQRARLDRAIAADERHDGVLVAWLCAQQLRSAYKATSPVEGRRVAEKILLSLPTCPIPEIKRLAKTLKQWRGAFLAYFDTARANNGGTEAINGLIELHRRIARGFRNREHYRLPMLLIGGGLAHPHLR